MKRNVGILGLLLFLFSAPGLIAYGVYVHPEWIHARTNHGQLLQPPPLLPESLPEGKWQLLYWTPDKCTQTCMARLNDLAKMRLALGRKLYYVDLVLATQTPLTEASQALKDDLEQEDGHWLQLGEKLMPILGEQPAIYIVNPQHYVILAYATDCPLQGIFKDLQKMVHDK